MICVTASGGFSLQRVLRRVVDSGEPPVIRSHRIGTLVSLPVHRLATASSGGKVKHSNLLAVDGSSQMGSGFLEKTCTSAQDWGQIPVFEGKTCSHIPGHLPDRACRGS